MLTGRADAALRPVHCGRSCVVQHFAWRDAETGRLLGCVIVAPECANSIQTLATALRFGMTVMGLGGMILPHLTILAAQSFDGAVVRLSCCAGRSAQHGEQCFVDQAASKGKNLTSSPAST